MQPSDPFSPYRLISFGAWGSYACTTNVKIRSLHASPILTTIFVCKFNNLLRVQLVSQEANKAEVLYSKYRNMARAYVVGAWDSLCPLFEGRVCIDAWNFFLVLVSLALSLSLFRKV